jgi:hypothetical protein
VTLTIRRESITDTGFIEVDEKRLLARPRRQEVEPVTKDRHLYCVWRTGPGTKNGTFKWAQKWAHAGAPVLAHEQKVHKIGLENGTHFGSKHYLVSPILFQPKDKQFAKQKASPDPQWPWTGSAAGPEALSDAFFLKRTPHCRRKNRLQNLPQVRRLPSSSALSAQQLVKKHHTLKPRGKIMFKK